MPREVAESAVVKVRYPKNKGLRTAQVCSRRTGRGEPVREVERHKRWLQGRRSEKDKRDQPPRKVELSSTVQVVFHVVIDRTIGSPELEVMVSPPPGETI